eukprot:symbB.v1.2.004252.t1/scaffold241.1/size254724/7
MTNGTVPTPPDGEGTAEAEAAEEKPSNGEAKVEAETAETNGDAKEETEKEDKEETEEKEEKEEKDEKMEETLEPPPAPVKRAEPRFEWVEVVKKRKLTKTMDLRITATGTPGMSSEDLQKRQDEETKMQAEMREIIETDEKKNDLEGYIFNARAKISDSGEWVSFIAPEDREKFEKELQKAEDWLYDNFDGTKVQYIDKLDELKTLGNPVQYRHKESGMREEWLRAVRNTVANYRKVAEQPGDRYGHIAKEKLEKILVACTECESWLAEQLQKQESMPKYQKPILTCADMEKRSQELAKMSDEILKEPKPREEPKEIHLDEKDEKEDVEVLEEEAAAAEEGNEEMEEKEEAAKGDEPQDMEVD